MSANDKAEVTIPRGWKMVPFWPTDAMLEAACHDTTYTAPRRAWAAMLAAAPTAPAQAASGGEVVAHTSERHFALREAHGHRSEEDYFAARPNLDGPDERTTFRAGFARGFDAGEKVYATPASAPPAGDLERAHNAGFVEAARIHGPQIERMADALRSIRSHVEPLPGALAAAILATCDNGLRGAPPAGDPPAPAAAREVVEALRRSLQVAVDSDLGRLWVWPLSAREQWMKDVRAALAAADAQRAQEGGE